MGAASGGKGGGMTQARGTGRTARQLLDAPDGAVFICGSRSGRDYTRDLAAHLKRRDIFIISKREILSALERQDIPCVILDHAIADVPSFRLKTAEKANLTRVLRRIGRGKTGRFLEVA
jgi:hypothetical protein